MAAVVLTQDHLLGVVPDLRKDRADEFVASFNMWAVHFGIDTPLRAAHYLSQVFHESACLKHTEENLNYSVDGLLRTFPKYFRTRQEAEAYARKPEKIANRVYANRMGNGSEASGDGWKYRGRGFIMTTGKDNYRLYAKSDWCVGDLMANPEWLASSPGDQKSSMFFWQRNNCNRYADRDDVKGLTKKINGGYNGLEQRKDLLSRFKKVLHVQ